MPMTISVSSGLHPQSVLSLPESSANVSIDPANPAIADTCTTAGWPRCICITFEVLIHSHANPSNCNLSRERAMKHGRVGLHDALE